MSHSSSPDSNSVVHETILGYLNFAEGAADARVLQAFDQAMRAVVSAERPSTAGPQADARRLEEPLRAELDRLVQRGGAFQDSRRARVVLDLLFQHVLPAYAHYHADLLFHQRPESLFNGYFVARASEALVQDASLDDEPGKVAERIVLRLSDFVGHRPLATLEHRRLVVNPHERVRPVPLYISGAGVACGVYEPVVSLALELLRGTDEDLLLAAQFEPESLEELAFDPRAYDFDHPVNRRPNYHFGLWDPDVIDAQGNYRRFVVQQVTLDALHTRLRGDEGLPEDELRYEAAAVLAGTILMASGISGRGPGSIDSEQTLGQLLTRIARFRDDFYDRLLARVPGKHGERLRDEAKLKRQAFGAARQHINGALARRRASQLEHVHLAELYARLGCLGDAVREANIVPVAAARMTCLLDCALVSAQRAIEDQRWQDARERLLEAIETMHRAIRCGALIDPWNILGFDAHFPLFQGFENSVHDERADELIGIIDRIFGTLSRFWNEASAADHADDVNWVRGTFEDLAHWWQQFAAHEVTSVEAPAPLVTLEASRHVADCLALWRRSGAAAGDVEFWAKHADRFDSPTAYALVVEALLDRGDFLASRGLLMHWLGQGQAERVPLEQSPSSYFDLAYRWMMEQFHEIDLPEDVGIEKRGGTWKTIVRWFDQLEANAESYWIVPRFDTTNGKDKPGRGRNSDSFGEEYPAPEFSDSEEDDDEVGIYGAAYEDVVYQDSTDDGVDASLEEAGGRGNYDSLELEAKRIGKRIAFLSHVAKLWKVSGLTANVVVRADESRYGKNDDPTQVVPRRELAESVLRSLEAWVGQARKNREDFEALLRSVQQRPLSRPSADPDALLEYDRERLIKENLLDSIIGVCVETEDAIRTMVAMIEAIRLTLGIDLLTPRDDDPVARILSAVLLRNRDIVRLYFPTLIERLSEEALLYVPIAKGGDPHQVMEARVRRTAIQELLVCLPRLGLLDETQRLIDLAREMEQRHPVGHGAVTEFDELFRIGHRAMVDSLVQWSMRWDEQRESLDGEEVWGKDDRLFLAVEQLVERSLVTWLEHSKTLRLSVLEKVQDRQSWQLLENFIKQYGGDLFTQRFFNLGNLRAILHQGVGSWLEQMKAHRGEVEVKLIEALDESLPRRDAERWLTLVLESVIENFAEYRDYNSTTTQSDRGDMLYMLLDFLRLRVRYDRVAWNLKPVVWAHEVLVRGGCENVARRWRRAVRQRIGNEPDRYLGRLAKLQERYAMRMSSVQDRIQERFIMPMRIDRLRSLVDAAMRQPGSLEAEKAFDGLRLETRLLTAEPTGAGLDVPRWLAALEEEVDKAASSQPWDIDLREALVPHVEPVAEIEVFEQLARMRREIEDDDGELGVDMESDE
ncbi:MAG: hypothetical protein R3B96_01020 [Pirellulaceae bacterium]